VLGALTICYSDGVNPIWRGLALEGWPDNLPRYEVTVIDFIIEIIL
jgi:hypothetical protein